LHFQTLSGNNPLSVVVGFRAEAARNPSEPQLHFEGQVLIGLRELRDQQTFEAILVHPTDAKSILSSGNEWTGRCWLLR
jgi:hypothetical protein